MAFRVFNLLANGMGGLDWAALPLWCARFGITNVEGLMDRLEVLKTHRPEKAKE